MAEVFAVGEPVVAQSTRTLDRIEHVNELHVTASRARLQRHSSRLDLPVRAHLVVAHFEGSSVIRNVQQSRNQTSELIATNPDVAARTWLVEQLPLQTTTSTLVWHSYPTGARISWRTTSGSQPRESETKIKNITQNCGVSVRVMVTQLKVMSTFCELEPKLLHNKIPYAATFADVLERRPCVKLDYISLCILQHILR